MHSGVRKKYETREGGGGGGSGGKKRSKGFLTAKEYGTGGRVAPGGGGTRDGKVCGASYSKK